jgi:hypothetical protein
MILGDVNQKVESDGTFTIANVALKKEKRKHFGMKQIISKS